MVMGDFSNGWKDFRLKPWLWEGEVSGCGPLYRERAVQWPAAEDQCTGQERSNAMARPEQCPCSSIGS